MSGGFRDDVGRFTVSCTSIQFLCLIFLVSCPIFVDKCTHRPSNPGKRDPIKGENKPSKKAPAKGAFFILPSCMPAGVPILPPMRQSTQATFPIRIRGVSKLPMRQSTARRRGAANYTVSKLPMRQSTRSTDPQSLDVFSKLPMRQSTIWQGCSGSL